MSSELTTRLDQSLCGELQLAEQMIQVTDGISTLSRPRIGAGRAL